MATSLIFQFVFKYRGQMFDEIMLMTTLMQNVVALVLHPFLSCMLKDSIEALMDYVVPFHSLGGNNVRLLKHFGTI